MSWLVVMDRLGGWVLALPGLLDRGARKGAKQASEWSEARALREEREEARKTDSEIRLRREKVKIEPPAAPAVEKSERAKREQQIPLFHVNDGSGVPPLALLDDPKPQPKGYDAQTLETLPRQIEFKLKDFRIDAEVVGAYPGPVITRFEVQPAAGVKVSQISSLDKDIARGLSVKSVRVVDVIPGKSVIGLETPNTSREMIYLSELLRSKEYDKSPSPLTLAPVSYTHLDVYKRQVLGEWPMATKKPCTGISRVLSSSIAFTRMPVTPASLPSTSSTV